jgi:ATP-dependent DNA helicase RecG
MILRYLGEYKFASRKDIDDLLADNLSDSLDQKQKRNKIHNLLQSMSKQGKIVNTGSNRHPKWVIGDTSGDPPPT